MKFVPIKYLVDSCASDPRLVDGFAFETPGWPEWHACVRYGNRGGPESIFSDWIVDHFETGLALSVCGYLNKKEDAPAVMAKVLNEKGREKVHKRLAELGLPV